MGLENTLGLLETREAGRVALPRGQLCPFFGAQLPSYLGMNPGQQEPWGEHAADHMEIPTRSNSGRRT